MTFYDFVLLARARWRWFLVLPAVSITVTAAGLLLTPGAHGARAVVRIDPSFPAARALSLLTRYAAVEPRKSDGQVMALTASAATPHEAVVLVTAAITSVTNTARSEARQRQNELARLMQERRRLLARRDQFALIDYKVLAVRIERLRSSTPAAHVTIIEIIEPIVTIRPQRLRPYPLAASGMSALVVVFLAACVQAWWVAERALRSAPPSSARQETT